MIAAKGHRRSLFPAPETLAGEGPLFLVEGEPDAISAAELGIDAVAVPGVQGWRCEYVTQGYRPRGRSSALTLIPLVARRPRRSARTSPIAE